MYQEILYDVSGGIATITLNRPDKLNAWTAQMDVDVRAAIASAEKEESARVIVLTGAGRGFCAGADMSLLSEIAGQGLAPSAEHALGHQTAGPAREGVRPDFQRKYSYFPAIEKPVIAAINGHAVGLGLILPLYCDLRFASTEAKFGTARSHCRVRDGVDAASPDRPCKRVGRAAVRENLRSGRSITYGPCECGLSRGILHRERARLCDGSRYAGLAAIDVRDQTASL
jgi:1,4-dihydroxy-2-naphthoyl-CoA synthase